MFVQTLEVDIMPKGKERPRVGNYGHIYTPPAQFEHERAIRSAWMAKYGIEPVSERCPVAVTISFSKTLPKSVREPRPWIIKPDIDNLAKSVLDALNGVAYADDAQIVSLTVTKQPQTRETVTGISITVVSFDAGEWEVVSNG